MLSVQQINTIAQVVISIRLGRHLSVLLFGVGKLQSSSLPKGVARVEVLRISAVIMFRMLTALDDDLDEVTERMNFVMSRLGKLLKTKSESGGTPCHSNNHATRLHILHGGPFGMCVVVGGIPVLSCCFGSPRKCCCALILLTWDSGPTGE